MMKFVKLAIISLIVFSVLLWLMSLLIPSTVRISRAINIDAERAVIMPYVSDTSKWKLWNELVQSGLITVKMEETGGDYVRTRWSFKGRDVESAFRLEESAGTTVVQWYFDFHLRWYPWEKFGSITFDKQFGIPMERSLDKLKQLMGNSP